MHTLPDLPYAFNALEPHIDTQTMGIHHAKHHQGYVDKLNAALEGHDDLMNKDIAQLISNLNKVPEDIRTAVRNNGGGHYNHSLFWTSLTSKSTQPEGELLNTINQNFGDLKKMKEMFNNAAATRFGSGWAWLVKKDDGKLEITSTPNQDNPIMEDASVTPLLGLDVWEHAYYLSYQNRRADYIEAWWNVVNWEEVEARYREKS